MIADRPPTPPAGVRKLIDGGLSFPIDSGVLHGLIRHLHRLLLLKAPAANDEFVRILHAIADASGKRIPRLRELACAKGCSLCCRTHVSMLAPEAFAMARGIRDAAAHAGLHARLRTTAAALPGTSQLERRRTGLHCSFLVDDACSAYGARPVTCRMMASFNLRACEVTAMGGPDLVPQPGEYANIRSLLALAALAALHGAGLPLGSYELNQTISLLVDAPELEARYYAGDAAFGVQVAGKDELAPAFITQIRQMAAAAGL